MVPSAMTGSPSGVDVAGPALLAVGFKRVQPLAVVVGAPAEIDAVLDR